MFLSFIVPVYNAERYLGECLDSLLNQDIEKDDYEIVCVNDGSKDGSPALLREYAEKYPNIVILNKENGGVVSARNAGMKIARGDYIWFVDSDDFIRENILSRLRRKAEESNCDRLIVGGYEFTDALSEEERACASLPINCPWYDAVVWRGLLRRCFLEKHGLYFRCPDLTHGEDGLFMYEVAACSPAAVEIEEALYFYRVHSGSAETAQSLESQKKKLRSYVRIAEIMRSYYDSGRHDPGTANKLMTFLHFALYMVAGFPGKDAKEALAELKQKGLFPFCRPAECTLDRSYMISRTDIIGKAFDKVYLNQHRPWGYALMRTAMQGKNLIRKRK